MYRNDFTGCVLSLLFFILLLTLLKEFWWIIVGIALIWIAAYWGRKIYYLLLSSGNTRNNSYNPQAGEVYKLCPYCNSKLRVSELTCPHCGRALN